MPYFERNPTENAKYIVKLILEKGMDPNRLNEKFLNRDAAAKSNITDMKLPEKILDTSTISLAIVKY